MKKLPSKLKIGGHIFTVKQCGLDFCGETRFQNSEIRINKDMAQSLKESTLIHEILCHCLNTTLMGDDDKNGHMMHAVLDSMSEQLYQVLKQNKMLR